MAKFRFRKKRFIRKKAKVAKAVKKYVKRTLDRTIEDKYSEIDIGTSSVGIIPQYNLLSHNISMIQGTGSNNRIGDKIRLKYLDLKMLVGAGQLYSTYFRVLLVKYNHPNGSAITTGDLMFNTGGYGAMRPLFPKNVLSEKGITVLMDKYYTIKALGNTTSDYNYRPISIKKRLGWTQSYLRNSNVGTIADVEKGALYLVIFGGVDTGGLSTTQIRDIQYTLTFEDA